MLIDNVIISIEAGNGGKGAVAFNTNVMSLGPAGGSGGRGGNVYAEGVSDLGALNTFRFEKKIKAENGMDGRSQFRDGHDGKDLIIKVPVGTLVHNLQKEGELTIEHIGERVLLAQGGKGGKGNFQFRSSRNTTPKQFQPGLPGEQWQLRLELKLIADVGFVGLPNAGKSSMLNCLTNAKSKVANYPFTTLEPNLGVYYELILADIPGLIEGSSEGRGLGIKFLRHIERTKTLFHFISAESENVKKDYKTIQKELENYNPELLEKPEYLFLTKTDLLDEATLKKQMKVMKTLNANASSLSLQDEESIKNIQKILNKIKDKKIKNHLNN